MQLNNSKHFFYPYQGTQIISASQKFLKYEVLIRFYGVIKRKEKIMEYLNCTPKLREVRSEMNSMKEVNPRLRIMYNRLITERDVRDCPTNYIQGVTRCCEKGKCSRVT